MRPMPIMVCALLMAGCGSVAPRAPGPAQDVPERFLVLDVATGRQMPARDDGACHSPLVDPRNGTRLLLERSDRSQGDYEPETPAYGVDARHRLRVDCRDGRAVGVVGR